jgi:signal transduction histidine kinase
MLSETKENLGDLLVKAQVLNETRLARAAGASLRTGATLGQALVESGELHPRMVRAGILALVMLREHILPESIALKALALAQKESIDLEKALHNIGFDEEYHRQATAFARLLVKLGKLSEEELVRALEVSHASGLPLGRVILARKVVDKTELMQALRMQGLVHEGRLSVEKALDMLVESSTGRATLEDLLEAAGINLAPKPNRFKLGELLIIAGVVQEDELLQAVEMGLLKGKPMGHFLIQQDNLDQATLDQALRLQSLVNNHEIEPLEAASTLSAFHASKTGISKGEKKEHERLIALRNEEQGTALLIDSDILARFNIQNSSDITRIINDLVFEKQNLAYKVASQEEEMKHRLARELHDTIIADLMMLKRYITGDKQLTTEQIVEIIDHVLRQLRDVCSDFAPRHLKEWGLRMCIEDLLQRLTARTGMKTNLNWLGAAPDLPDPVLIHIFRIIQEALNNVEKYSGATRVDISVELAPSGTLKFLVADNGHGKSTAHLDEEDSEGNNEDVAERDATGRSGGMGMSGMKERCDIIRCFLPAKLSIENNPGHGYKTFLEVMLPVK